MTLEKLNKLNEWMIGLLKVAYLNLLWVVFTILGLGIFSVGPATYAMMAYYDYWLRQKESLPVAKSFWKFFKENYRQSFLVSLIYLAIGAIFTVNIFFNRVWSIQMVNVIMLILVLFSFTHVFTLMSAVGYKKIVDLLKAAILLGFGYLHYGIIAWTVIGVFYFLTATFFPGMLFVFGVGFTGLLCSLASKQVFKDFLPQEQGQ